MQSYASVVEANDYHNARQSANRWDDFSDEDKQRRLTSASDLIDRSFDFLGLPENNLHAFPRFLPIERRVGLFEREQKLSQTPILPEAVKRACCELALLDDISGSDALVAPIYQYEQQTSGVRLNNVCEPQRCNAKHSWQILSRAWVLLPLACSIAFKMMATSFTLLFGNSNFPLPEVMYNSSSNFMACVESGTRWSRRFFILCAGMCHKFSGSLKSFHSARRISMVRTAVYSISQIAIFTMRVPL